jgi:uncharacterized protein YndB with AHSA1/START domain
MNSVNYSEQINATPAQVWAVLSNATRLPDWTYTEGRFPYPVEGKYGSEQTEGPGTIWIGVSSDGQTATQKITDWEPGKKLVYELQETENAPQEMTQTNIFDLETVDDQTKVTWTLNWELTGGFSLGKLLFRLTGNGAFEEMMAGSLENLKVLVEEETAQTDSSESEEAE